MGDEGKFSDAEPLVQQALAMRRKLPSGDPLDVAISLEDLALIYQRQGRTNDLKSLAQDALDLREKNAPDKWQTFRARSELGGILLDEKKLTETEPPLVRGFEGIKQRQTEIPAEQRGELRKAAQRLVQLYQAKSQTEKVAAYQKELEAL